MILTTMDRHITGRILGTYVFLVLVLVIFFVLLHYLEYIDDFLDRNAPMRKIYFVYYPSFVPDIIRQVSPLALFLAAIFTTGRLAQSFQDRCTANQWRSAATLHGSLLPDWGICEYTHVFCWGMDCTKH